MHKFAPWLALCLLSACGMKGDLVLPEPPATPAAEDPALPGTKAPVPSPEQADEPESRGVNPPSPDPTLVP